MNLHDELGRHGADAADEAAQRLSSRDVRSALNSRVRQGRRRRAVGGGVGAVAGIALVAVGVWGVLPGDTLNSEPAAPEVSIDPDLEARGEVYRIDESAPVGPVAEIDVRRSQSMVCGTPFDLDEGVMVHDTSVIAQGVTMAALSAHSFTPEEVTEEWLRGLDEEEVNDSWDNFVGENPTEVDVSEEQHVFESQVVTDGTSNTTWTSVPLLLHDGEIVSVGDGSGATGWETEPSRKWTPNPGACETGGSSDPYGDGTYEPVLVTQFWDLEPQDLLATVVASAGEIEYTGLGAPEVDDPESLGNTWGDDALASVIEVREWTGGLECAALLDDPDFVTGTGDAGDVVGSIPVPRTLETGRLYGYGDDALVGGYPIPVGRADGDPDSVERMTGVGDMRLLLRGVDGTWVFNARWSERDDLPHDEPGWFVELNQVWDCGSPDLVPEGEYSASLVVPEMGDVYDLTAITVVSGVPSIPEIDAQG